LNSSTSPNVGGLPYPSEALPLDFTDSLDPRSGYGADVL
jgi:hypothetical protein